jgi:hypothetical protein
VLQKTGVRGNTGVRGRSTQGPAQSIEEI